MELHKDVPHGTGDYPFQVHRTELTNGLHLYPHIHEEAEITYITEGAGIFCVDGSEYSVKAGDIIFVPSNRIHLAYSDNNGKASFSSIVFSTDCFSFSKESRIYKKYVRPVLNNEIRFTEYVDNSFDCYEKLTECVKIIDSAYFKENSELICLSKLFEIWNIWFEDCSEFVGNPDDINYGKRLGETIEYMRTNYQNRITVKDLAQIAHMSEGHFSRIFKNYMKLSPMEYLIHIRIYKSAELLIQTDMPIGEIAMNCGFNDFSYFGQQFRKELGTTPREYRKKKG